MKLLRKILRVAATSMGPRRCEESEIPMALLIITAVKKAQAYPNQSTRASAGLRLRSLVTTKTTRTRSKTKTSKRWRRKTRNLLEGKSIRDLAANRDHRNQKMQHLLKKKMQRKSYPTAIRCSNGSNQQHSDLPFTNEDPPKKETSTVTQMEMQTLKRSCWK